MDINGMHPREQLVFYMKQLYDNKLTNLSGGNLSIRDDHGNIWITPTGVDKGFLQPQDILCVKPDGSIAGPHKVTTELPFHRAILHSRSDLRAVVHTHTPSLVAYSFARQVPDTRLIPRTFQVCGSAGIAEYAIPGSQRLGDNMAHSFANGFNVLILENHGAAAVGKNLAQAVNRLETLAICAQVHIKARCVGNILPLSDQQLEGFLNYQPALEQCAPPANLEKAASLKAQQMVTIIHRACQQNLMSSLEGDVSIRIGAHAFLTTPADVDRRFIKPKDLVMVIDSKREAGKFPGRLVCFHQAILAAHPQVNCVITAQPPNSMVYAVSDAEFNTRLIPESYILLADPHKLPLELAYQEPAEAASRISLSSPCAFLSHDSLVVVARDILRAFDRLEEAEFTAWSLIDAQSVGELVPLSHPDLQELQDTFLS